MTDLTQPHLFCFGLGYSAKFLANFLLAQGWRVSGTHRNLNKCESERANGITAYTFDEGIPLENIWDLNTVTHVLISISPTDIGDVVYNQHLNDLKNLPNLRWLGYLSTTGVYGNHDGKWVSEETTPNPSHLRTKKRIEIEKLWLDSGLPVHIFRLAGIYGNGRNSLIDLRNNLAKRINKPNHFFSRIHVADIANILNASMNLPKSNTIYNCADDYPCPQSEVVTYAAKLLNISPPNFIELEQAQLSPMGQSFYADNKKVSNQKIKDELGINLIYPTYKEGLLSCLNDLKMA